jgi:hypothetical protein
VQGRARAAMAAGRDRRGPLLALLLLLLGAAALADAKVIELSDENFDSLTKKGVWLVDIYAPW